MQYSVKQASEITGLPIRTIQYRCKTQNVKKVNKKYIITQNHIDKWMPNARLHDNMHNVIVEEFTEEQYNKLQEVIEQYPLQIESIKHLQELIKSYQDQIEYLRKSLDKKDVMMNKLVDSLDNHIKNLMQKNYIEAIEKNIK